MGPKKRRTKAQLKKQNLRLRDVPRPPTNLIYLQRSPSASPTRFRTSLILSATPPPPGRHQHHLRRRLVLFRLNPSLASAAAATPPRPLQCGWAAAMDGSGSAAVFPNTRTPEDVFTDFRARRAGILKALTTGISPSCSRGRFFGSGFCRGTRDLRFRLLGCFRGAQMWRSSTSCATQVSNLACFCLFVCSAGDDSCTMRWSVQPYCLSGCRSFTLLDWIALVALARWTSVW